MLDIALSCLFLCRYSNRFDEAECRDYPEIPTILKECPYKNPYSDCGRFRFADLRFTSVSQQLDERPGFGRQLGSWNQIAGHLPICNRKSGLGECIGDFAPTEKPDVMTSEWPTNHDLTGGCHGYLHYGINDKSVLARLALTLLTLDNSSRLRPRRITEISSSGLELSSYELARKSSGKIDTVWIHPVGQNSRGERPNVWPIDASRDDSLRER